MVKIRLARHGSKKKPIYRIVVTANESPRDGRFIEMIGLYDPAKGPEKVTFKQDKLDAWLKKGAQPTQTVSQLIRKAAKAATATAA